MFIFVLLCDICLLIQYSKHGYNVSLTIVSEASCCYYDTVSWLILFAICSVTLVNKIKNPTKIELSADKSTAGGFLINIFWLLEDQSRREPISLQGRQRVKACSSSILMLMKSVIWIVSVKKGFFSLFDEGDMFLCSKSR